MHILITFLFIINLSGCTHNILGTNIENKSFLELEGIPNFESLVGSGTLEINSTGTKPEYSKAWLSFNDDYTVIGKGSCEALTLTSIKRPILAVAKCDDNNYYICGRAPNECRINHETIRSGNTLSLTKDLGFGEDDIKLIVDFHKDKFVYRVQGKSCFIGYPHGCIIDGFSWVDEDIYSFGY